MSRITSSKTCLHEPCKPQVEVVNAVNASVNAVNASVNALNDPWAEVAALANASNESFHALVTPLSLMTKLTYTATFGTYYNKSEQNMTVPGWTRPLTENPPVGMRALLFVDAATSRGVVAFRGTDLGQTPSGACDQCADDVLAGVPIAALPVSCRQFPNATLDYYSAAVAFVRRVRDAYPHLELLYTGHSLGAGLAFALATVARAPTAPVSPAVAFAVPPYLQWLHRRAPRVPLPSPEEARARFYFLADEWDPVQVDSVQAKGLLGTQCLWSSPEPLACKLCYEKPLNRSSPACIGCFVARHIYAHYLHVDVPGPRPACAPIPVAVDHGAALGRVGAVAMGLGATCALFVALVLVLHWNILWRCTRRVCEGKGDAPAKRSRLP